MFDKSGSASRRVDLESSTRSPIVRPWKPNGSTAGKKVKVALGIVLGLLVVAAIPATIILVSLKNEGKADSTPSDLDQASPQPAPPRAPSPASPDAGTGDGFLDDLTEEEKGNSSDNLTEEEKGNSSSALSPPPPSLKSPPSPSPSPASKSANSSSGPVDIPGWAFLWGDEFDGQSLDTSKWSYDLGRGDWGWGNNELQSYTSDPANVKLEDGSLLITAVKAPDGSYTSGRINTKASASFMPGMEWGGDTVSTIRVEGRIRIPQPPAQGLWAAFWLFPKDLKYGVWPASGEIDIAESINAMTEVTQCIHYGGPGPEWVMWPEQARQPNNAPWSDTYHTYAVDWSVDTLQFSIDGKNTFTMHSRDSQNGGKGWYSTGPGAGPNSPFDHPFFIILNLAIGGNFPKDPDASTRFPATMAVDYVRVYGK